MPVPTSVERKNAAARRLDKKSRMRNDSGRAGARDDVTRLVINCAFGSLHEAAERVVRGRRAQCSAYAPLWISGRRPGHNSCHRWAALSLRPPGRDLAVAPMKGRSRPGGTRAAGGEEWHAGGRRSLPFRDRCDAAHTCSVEETIGRRRRRRRRCSSRFCRHCRRRRRRRRRRFCRGTIIDHNVWHCNATHTHTHTPATHPPPTIVRRLLRALQAPASLTATLLVLQLCTLRRLLGVTRKLSTSVLCLHSW